SAPVNPAPPRPAPAPGADPRARPAPAPQPPGGLNRPAPSAFEARGSGNPASPAFEARGSGPSPGIPASPAFEARGSGGGAPGSGAAPGLLGRLLRRGGRPDPADLAEPAAGDPAGDVARTRNLGLRRARTEVLRGIDLTVAPGETIALMGRNGAGKSTLLSTLVGTLAPTTGEVTVGGRTPHRTAPPEMVRRVGLVPQEPRDLLYADTVAAECAAADSDAGAAPGTCRALVSGLLPGVPDDTHPRDLSEGQRLALALALVLTGRPALLLLDEPTRGLDYAAKARLIEILRGLAADGHAVVLATHDVELAAELADRVVILAGGEVVADGPTAEVVVSSPAFAPQVAKVLAPGHWLTVGQVAEALDAAAPR
ncbi:energy-coupling factor ABC transporter ATP-binding protein, partial [Streptomyces erythrochromogenes]|uniref:energy-coupling factor ABC transporter ATP-binding protein n=1 Tax=Streptomyces erythrochromogenes TaxID=285574 RepID=UPI003689F6D0